MATTSSASALTGGAIRGDLTATSTPATAPQVRPADAMTPTMDRPTLTAEDLAADGTSPRTVRWRIAQWRTRGWPRVYQVPRRGRVGGVAWAVDRLDYEAMVRGDPPEIAQAA